MCNKTEKIYGFRSGKKNAETTPSRLVEKGIKCDYVILSVWNTENDAQDSTKMAGSGFAYSETEDDILWGFDGECVHQLFPQQTTPLLIPVKDAGDIFIRRNKRKASGVMVGFSCFRKEIE